AQQPRDLRRRQKAGSPAAEVDGLELLKRMALARKHELVLQRVDVLGDQAVHAGVRIEVAVPALVAAEGEVDIQVPECLQSCPFTGRSARLAERARTGGSCHPPVTSSLRSMTFALLSSRRRSGSISKTESGRPAAAHTTSYPSRSRSMNTGRSVAWPNGGTPPMA